MLTADAVIKLLSASKITFVKQCARDDERRVASGAGQLRSALGQPHDLSRRTVATRSNSPSHRHGVGFRTHERFDVIQKRRRIETVVLEHLAVFEHEDEYEDEEEDWEEWEEEFEEDDDDPLNRKKPGRPKWD